MNKRKVHYVLGIYDAVLALGATMTGLLMLLGKGVFNEFPKEWLSNTPFNSWTVIGLIILVVFGIGNIVASGNILFKNDTNKSWVMSAVMGGVLLLTLIAQIVILGEWYMATVQFLVLSLIQLVLSFRTYMGCRSCINE